MNTEELINIVVEHRKCGRAEARKTIEALNAGGIEIVGHGIYLKNRLRGIDDNLGAGLAVQFDEAIHHATKEAIQQRNEWEEMVKNGSSSLLHDSISIVIAELKVTYSVMEKPKQIKESP